MALCPWDGILHGESCRIQEWIGLDWIQSPGVDCHFLPQGGLPNPGIQPGSPALQADSLLTEPLEKPIYLKKEKKKVNVLKTLHVLNTNLANFIGGRTCWLLLARKEA